MKHKLIIPVLCFLMIACATLAPATPAVTETPSATFTTTPTSEPTITPTPFYDVKPGRSIILPGGGVKFSAISGYSVELDDFSAVFKSKDKNIIIGVWTFPPVLGSKATGMARDFAEYFAEDLKDVSLSDPEKMNFHGVEAAFVEVIGIQQGKPSRVKVIVFDPDGSKAAAVIVNAIGDQRWEREGHAAFDAILDGISFFHISQLSDCPISPLAGYGSTPEKPVKIGRGSESDSTRVNNYLYSLLGPNDEIVNTRFVNSITVNGVTLDQYELLYGRQARFIYIDKYHYDELNIPPGLSCSVHPPTDS